MPIDQKNLEAFARGPAPGAGGIAPAMAADESDETDADDTAQFEGPIADFVHVLEQHAGDVAELGYELTDEQLDAPSSEPSEEDRNIVLQHLEDGALDPVLVAAAKKAGEDFAFLSAEEAETIAEHLVSEGMVDDASSIAPYLLVLASVIDQVDVAEDDADAEEELDEEADDADLSDEDIAGDAEDEQG